MIRFKESLIEKEDHTTSFSLEEKQQWTHQLQEASDLICQFLRVANRIFRDARQLMAYLSAVHAAHIDNPPHQKEGV